MLRHRNLLCVSIWLVAGTASCGAPVDERGGEGRSAAAAAERASAALGALLDSAWARDLETSPIIRHDEDLDGFVSLVEQVPSHVRDLEGYVKGQFERDFIVSSQNLTPVIQLVRATAGEAEGGPFALPADRAAGPDPDRVAEAEARIGDIVRDSINPALEELAAFLEGPYAARAPAGVGLSQYPEGRDYYLYLTRLHTTMEVTPEEVQAAGHELLAEFRRRMADIRDRLGWEGSAESFHEHLKTDPRYRGVPEAPWDARRLAPELEPAMTYGYYSAPTAAEPTGIYYYNGSNLDQRSWLGLASISLHELISGHHFQIAGQRDSETLPDYRRNTSYTAYILESFLATRLVVDPGMNYFGMTREEARQFMRENTLESETRIATESLRYSTDLPGQALAYQMGKRKLLALRARAEDALGDGFDIRRFHDVVLRNGSVPMVVLEGQVDAWIDAEGGGR
ncbi:DUF885 domain-containing protein [Candidatus Palauibacter sp.]|uniref:DUF885 domain-containing protein n=1 Tax=Candidatus Palauibacter sp. TaxID=3101350 RepID=UPI003B5B805C